MFLFYRQKIGVLITCVEALKNKNIMSRIEADRNVYFKYTVQVLLLFCFVSFLFLFAVRREKFVITRFFIIFI